MAYNNQYYNNAYYPQNPQIYPQNGIMMDTLNQYKGQYQQPMGAMPPTQNMTPDNDMLWVLGEVEATSYPVAPNNTVILWDKNNPTIYIKSANGQGVPSMRILDYTDRSLEAQNAANTARNNNNDKFVSLEDFNALKADFDALASQIEQIKSMQSKNAPSKKEKEDK